LKTIERSANGITEYFYDESKREVRITDSKGLISETRYKYQGNNKIEINFTRNPNSTLPSPQYSLNTGSQFYKYDAQNRIIQRTTSENQSSYEYSNNDKNIQESIKSFIASDGQAKPSAEYNFDIKGNMIEYRQSGQLNRYTYDDKIRPNSFNPSSNSGPPGEMSKNNVLTQESTGGWFGNSFVTYKYTYNKYNLPVTATSDAGDVIKYTYYE
jgi:hypothetical protein